MAGREKMNLTSKTKRKCIQAMREKAIDIPLTDIRAMFFEVLDYLELIVSDGD